MPLPCPGDSGDPILTTREAAGLLGIAVSTAQLWIENGLLPAWKTPGGHRRVRLSSVNALLRERGGTPPPPAALEASSLADSASEPVFDRLTWLATQVTGCPIALLSLATARRPWVKSRAGIAPAQAPFEDVFCTYTVAQDGPLMVVDAWLDGRFRDSALVRGEQVRFYAGFPLTGRDGRRVGALCVMDREPRRLRERELRALGELAALAAEEIRRR